MTGSVAYTYAVAGSCAALPQALTGLLGVGRAPVHLVHPTRGSDLVGVVSTVPEEEFDESALRRNLEDLGWLEAVARAHHGVIEAVAARTTVLPLRLATVYLDDERVRAMIDTRYGAFAERLAALAGLAEWGVKLYVDPSSGVRATPAPAAPAAEFSPGRAYLRRRRTQRDQLQDSYRAAEQAAERTERAARAHAVDRVRHRPQQGELATGPGVNVANDSYLVPLDRVESFRDDVVRSVDGLPGIRVDITGPWAPYSFAAPPDAALDTDTDTDTAGENLP